MAPLVRSGDGIHICLENGAYPLSEPIFLRPEDSGTADSPTIIRGMGEEASVLHGGMSITRWKKQGKLWVADVPEFNGYPLDFRQLWVNGKKAIRARDVSDFEKMYRILSNDPVNEILWVPTAAVKKILKAPRPEMVLHEMWCVAYLRIKSIEVHGGSFSPTGEPYPVCSPVAASYGHYGRTQLGILSDQCKRTFRRTGRMVS